MSIDNNVNKPLNVSYRSDVADGNGSNPLTNLFDSNVNRFRFLDLPAAITQAIGRYLRNVKDLITCFHVSKVFHQCIISKNPSDCFEFYVDNLGFVSWELDERITPDMRLQALFLFNLLAKNGYPLDVGVTDSFDTHSVEHIEILQPKIVRFKCIADNFILRVLSNCSENLRDFNIWSVWTNTVPENTAKLLQDVFKKSSNKLERLRLGVTVNAEILKKWSPYWVNILELSISNWAGELEAVICPKLENIIFNEGHYSGEILKKLSHNCPNIQSLHFIDEPCLNKSGFEAIGLYFQKLEALEITEDVDDIKLEWIFSKCLRPKELLLHSCEEVTVKGLKLILRYGSNLERLVMNDFDLNIEKELEDLNFSLPNLRSLSLSGSFRIFNPQIFCMFPNIRKLWLKSRFINDETLKTFPDQIQELTIPKTITSKGLETLMSFKNLKLLGVSSLTLTEEEAVDFKSRHPNGANLVIDRLY